jgi:hypothetical protein
MSTTLPHNSTARRNPNQSLVNDALVEFFAHAKGSSRVLHVLAGKTRPISYKILMDEMRFGGNWDHDLSGHAIRAVLSITQAAGLVRLTRHGFSISEIGREVHRRMQAEGKENSKAQRGTSGKEIAFLKSIEPSSSFIRT